MLIAIRTVQLNNNTQCIKKIAIRSKAMNDYFYYYIYESPLMPPPRLLFLPQSLSLLCVPRTIHFSKLYVLVEVIYSASCRLCEVCTRVAGVLHVSISFVSGARRVK